VNAIAVDTGKSFKFEINDPASGKWFLGNADGTATRDASKALVCTLSNTIMKCGGKGFPEFSGDMTMLATADAETESNGWSINAKDAIDWNAMEGMRFSVIGDDNQVWAEVCPHEHLDGHHGDAKAVWV
jgi:hypothetical protein